MYGNAVKLQSDDASDFFVYEIAVARREGEITNWRVIHPDLVALSWHYGGTLVALSRHYGGTLVALC